MDYLADDERRDEYSVRPNRRDELATMGRDRDLVDYGIDDPVVVGPGLLPEDGSCGQFAVQFHVSTATLAALKRIADVRGVSVPEVCRQVVGVFVSQQEGNLDALLSAENQANAYRPSLYGS